MNTKVFVVNCAWDLRIQMKEKRDINACDLSVADRGALQDVTLAISNGQAGREEEEDTGEGGKVTR